MPPNPRGGTIMGKPVPNRHNGLPDIKPSSFSGSPFNQRSHFLRGAPSPPPTYTYKTPNNNGEQHARQKYVLDRFDNLIEAVKTKKSNDELLQIVKIIDNYLLKLNPVSIQSLQAQAKERFAKNDYTEYLEEFFVNVKPPTLKLEGGTRKRRRNRKQKKTRRSSLKH